MVFVVTNIIVLLFAACGCFSLSPPSLLSSHSPSAELDHGRGRGWTRWLSLIHRTWASSGWLTCSFLSRLYPWFVARRFFVLHCVSPRFCPFLLPRIQSRVFACDPVVLPTRETPWVRWFSVVTLFPQVISLSKVIFCWYFVFSPCCFFPVMVILCFF